MNDLTPEDSAALAECTWLNASECTVDEVQLPAEVDDLIPAGLALIEVGSIEDMTYYWEGDGKRYRHRFPRGSAAIYITPQGGQGVVLVVGQFVLTERGFVDALEPEEAADGEDE
tara:strand:+ start:67 stop:411 length:345 start_codon:yes stop_codon:yes gene_type:complete